MASGGRRSGAGRKPKARALKELAGTIREDRELPVNADPASGPMVAPDYLGDLEQLLFQSLAQILEQQGRASPHYADVVGLLAQRLSQIRRYQAVLEVEGDTFTSTSMRIVHGEKIRTTMVRARPEVTMLSEAMRHAHSLLGDLMLTPATAMRLANGHKVEAGAFDGF